jgi:hypothetical protein
VVGIAAQPLLVRDADRRHVPDFLLSRADGWVLIVNVKPADRLDLANGRDPHDGRRGGSAEGRGAGRAADSRAWFVVVRAVAGGQNSDEDSDQVPMRSRRPTRPPVWGDRRRQPRPTGPSNDTRRVSLTVGQTEAETPLLVFIVVPVQQTETKLRAVTTFRTGSERGLARRVQVGLFAGRPGGSGCRGVRARFSRGAWLAARQRRLSDRAGPRSSSVRPRRAPA